MTIQEAIKSGKKIGRNGWSHFREPNTTIFMASIGIEDIIATDWQIEKEPEVYEFECHWPPKNTDYTSAIVGKKSPCEGGGDRMNCQMCEMSAKDMHTLRAEIEKERKRSRELAEHVRRYAECGLIDNYYYDSDTKRSLGDDVDDILAEYENGALSEKIDANMWREILDDKAKAKEALIGLTFEGDNGEPVSVKEVQLENGSTIPVEDVTEEQAHAFMSALCPDWAKELTTNKT